MPEHGPGASARTARQRHSTPPATWAVAPGTTVEVRDLAVYDALLENTEIAAPLLPRDPGGAERVPSVAATPDSPALAGVAS